MLMGKKLTRKTQCVLNDEQIGRMYRLLLIPIENDNLDLNGYKIDGQPFIVKKKEVGFDIDFHGDIKTGEDAVIDTFYCRKYKHYSSVPSLLIRIRNAFAHNRVFYNKQLNSIVLEDVDNDDLKMHVRLSSVDRLVEIVKAIRSTKGKHLKKKTTNKQKNNETV